MVLIRRKQIVDGAFIPTEALYNKLKDEVPDNLREQLGNKLEASDLEAYVKLVGDQTLDGTIQFLYPPTAPAGGGADTLVNYQQVVAMIASAVGGAMKIRGKFGDAEADLVDLTEEDDIYDGDAYICAVDVYAYEDLLENVTTFNRGDIAVKSSLGWIKVDNTDTINSVNGHIGDVWLSSKDLMDMPNHTPENVDKPLVLNSQNRYVPKSIQTLIAETVDLDELARMTMEKMRLTSETFSCLFRGGDVMILPDDGDPDTPDTAYIEPAEGEPATLESENVFQIMGFSGDPHEEMLVLENNVIVSPDLWEWSTVPGEEGMLLVNTPTTKHTEYDTEMNVIRPGTTVSVRVFRLERRSVLGELDAAPEDPDVPEEVIDPVTP